MEPSPTASAQQRLRSSIERHLETIRSRITTAFSGSSLISSRHSPTTPRIGLQLLAVHPGLSTESRPPASHARRNHSSSADSLVDASLSSDEPPRPRAAAHAAPGPRSTPEGHHRTRRTARRAARSARRERRYPQAAWVRPTIYDPSKVSGRERFCLGPGLRSRAARRRVMDCGVSAALLSVVLVIYLTLAFSSTVTAREFHVMMILVLMLLTIYLCHSLIRLFMIASRRFGDAATQRRIVRKIGSSSGYAKPDRPIPVRFARDEEIAAGEDSPTGGADGQGPVAKPPPAYGRWRSSVRINPNMIYWQRVDKHGHLKPQTGEQSNGAENPEASPNRPPSYISDDGVQYAVDIQPSRQPEPRLRDPADEFIHPAERSQIKS